jgi:glycosyltransferase involved in cell wall biosynthesis
MSEQNANLSAILPATGANKNKPLVSVIIPTYNSASFLPHSVESVLRQTYDHFELLVVDDGSTDNTQEVLAPYRDSIRYLKKANGGPSSSRNLGITEARGEFIAFQDSDDIWFPQKLALQVEHFRQNPILGVVFTGSQHFNENGLLDSNIGNGYAPPTGMIFDKLLTDHFIAMSSVMVRRSCIDEVGAFDESLIGAEDYNFFLRLARRFPYGFINEVLVQKRLHESNLSDNLEQMCEDEIKNLDKIASLFPDARIPKGRLSGHIYARFGRYYFNQQRFDEARACFRKAFRLSPLQVKTWHLWMLAATPQSLRNPLLTLNRMRKRAF